uniref:NAC153 n=1 Tax=Arundo donax TaxID=35708 RepID=A0A0A9B700_ARUDO
MSVADAIIFLNRWNKFINVWMRFYTSFAMFCQQVPKQFLIRRIKFYTFRQTRPLVNNIAIINDMAALRALPTRVAHPFLFTGIQRARSIFNFGSKSLAVNYPSCPGHGGGRVFGAGRRLLGFR